MKEPLKSAARGTVQGMERARLISHSNAALLASAAFLLAACGNTSDSAAPTVTVTASPSATSTIAVTATPTPTATKTSATPTPPPTKASPSKTTASSTCSQYAGDGSDAYSLTYPDNIRAYWCGEIASGSLSATEERARKTWVAYSDNDYAAVAKAKCTGVQDSGWTKTVANQLGVDRSFVIISAAWVWDCGPYR